MTYRNRIAVSAAGSIFLHGVVLVLWVALHAAAVPLPIPGDAPLILNLVAEEDPVKRLIETSEAADAPVEDTEFISDKDSIAKDMSDAEGERPQPFFEEPEDLDQLGKVASLPQDRKRPAPVMEELRPEVESPPAPTVEAVREEKESHGVVTLMDESLARPRSEDRESDLSSEETVKVADSQVTPVTAEWDAPDVGRTGGGTKAKGFTNFEAKDDSFAPYMLEVRKRVERRWRTALHLKYSGAGRTYAELECAISPDGEVVFVHILEAGSSVSYAAICKEAVERAGPFPPFPFEVPELYRNKNLEIRWRFSLL